MSDKRIFRISLRIKQDIKIIRIAKNWPTILSAKLSKKPIQKIELRNGIVIDAPDEIDLNFVFHEIWVDELYLPKGYSIKDDDVVLDIGANIGTFSLYAATKNKGVKVFSFEPFPSNADYLEKNIQQSGINNVDLFRGAVASSSGKRNLNISDSWIKHTLDENPDQQGGTIVNSISLDDALVNILKCNLLKVDCEGSEYEIFYSSSKETLSKIQKIVGEFHNRVGENENGVALMNFFKANGFDIDVYYDFDDESGCFAAKRKNSK